jgi:hypothetical protein
MAAVWSGHEEPENRERTPRVVSETNPHALCASNGDQSAPVSGICSVVSTHSSIPTSGYALKGTEQVTLPVYDVS